MIKDLLTTLKMKGAIGVLGENEHLKDRDQFDNFTGRGRGSKIES